MRIGDYFSCYDIVPHLISTTKKEVLEELTEKLLAGHSEIDRDEVFRVLLERELLGSTGIGGGIALPHAKLKHVGSPLVVFGRSTTGIAYDALDGRPVKLFFLLVADTDSVDLYLTLLARISRLLKDRVLRNRLLEAADANALYEIIQEQDNRL
ncbi:MAG: PTS sugar transporter subunit IIA [Geobacteraceae bacterium]|nr:PTS sugar transporter subunit IIA [Geobacteraceae bacterium]